ncbi:MAG: tripartite tricarboxylate transporter substrate binding protein [Xanthobacteraceae bacterium]|nr:tripartite tricarboxylate transporter substrate binding protein [Xanthobacteraceae bacterium]
MKRITVLALVLLSLSCSQVTAQNAYPEKPIRIITNAAGSLPDVVTRVVQPQLEKMLGKPIVIENIGGAGGSVAAERAARATPDGYTLLMTGDAALTTNVTMIEKLGYEPLKHFVPVSMLIDSVNILAVNPSFPAKTVGELVQAAKQQPGKLTFASAGLGTSQHLGGELLKRMAGIDIVHVTYKSIAQSTPDLLGGRLTMQFGNISAFLPQVREGRLRGLAVSSLKRVPQVPELPTMAEAGFPGFEATAWTGLAVPAGTPRDIVARLEELSIRVVNIPEVRQKLEDIGFVVMGMPGKQFAEQIKAEIETKGRLVRDTRAN